jgi:hypothetical protein
LDIAVYARNGGSKFVLKARLGRPVIATKSHQERAEEVNQEKCQIKEKLGISKERVGHIISLLGFRKVCASWVL